MTTIVVNVDGEARWGDGHSPRPLTDQEARALFWAQRATLAAQSRAEASRSDAFVAWTAAVEATWWLHAADDLLCKVIGKDRYLDARRVDEHGQFMQAMRWLRNLHLHELKVSGAGGAKRNFFGGPDAGYVLFISPANRWLPADQIKPEGEDADIKARRLYDEVIAGMPLLEVPKRATFWVRKVTQASGWDPPAEPADSTVL